MPKLSSGMTSLSRSVLMNELFPNPLHHPSAEPPKKGGEEEEEKKEKKRKKKRGMRKGGFERASVTSGRQAWCWVGFCGQGEEEPAACLRGRTCHRPTQWSPPPMPSLSTSCSPPSLRLLWQVTKGQGGVERNQGNYEVICWKLFLFLWIEWGHQSNLTFEKNREYLIFFKIIFFKFLKLSIIGLHVKK